MYALELSLVKGRRLGTQITNVTIDADQVKLNKTYLEYKAVPSKTTELREKNLIDLAKAKEAEENIIGET